MRRFEYAITVEERSHAWTLWHQDQLGPGHALTKPILSFESDLHVLRHMSQEGWELVCQMNIADKLPRLVFKRRLK